jgi:hypothetical protein
MFPRLCTVTHGFVICGMTLGVVTLGACSASAPDRQPNQDVAGTNANGGSPGVAGGAHRSAAVSSGGGATANTLGLAAGTPGLPPPAAVPAAAAGTFKPSAELDKNVRFEWQETAPGAPAAGACQPGVYTGTFQCTFVGDPAVFGTDVAGGFSLEVTGPISLELVQSANGEFLQISDGQFSAVAQLFFGFRAKLRGDLDCKSLNLSATTEGGMWALGDPDMPLLPGGDFAADVHGALNPKTGELSGQWSFTTGTIPGTCTGQWSATYTP